MLLFQINCADYQMSSANKKNVRVYIYGKRNTRLERKRIVSNGISRVTFIYINDGIGQSYFTLNVTRNRTHKPKASIM